MALAEAFSPRRTLMTISRSEHEARTAAGAVGEAEELLGTATVFAGR
jgi:hypothetical protein